MNPRPSVAVSFAHDAGWLWLHRALLPDYNGKAASYWWAMVVLGAAILGQAMHTLAMLPGPALLQVGVGAAIAMLAGFFPVRIPRSKNSFAAGEIFIFLLLLLHGPAAATLAAAGEGLIGSWRTSMRWSSRLASPAMGSLAMFCTGSALQAGMAGAQARGLDSAALQLVATMLCSVLYFMLNTVLITAVPYLKRNQWPVLREMLANFGWIGITYAGSASVACLLYLTFRQSGIGVLMAAAPIIGMLLCTLHYYFRQQQADEAVRMSHLAAIEREAELGARHVRQLRRSERRFHSAFTHASIGMALVSFDGRTLQINAAMRELLGVTHERAVDKRPFTDFVDPGHTAGLSKELEQVSSRQQPSFAVELRLRRPQADEVWVSVHGGVFSEAELDELEPDQAEPEATDVGTTCLILQVQDITARRQAEAGLHHIAFHDALTGLPNRRRFQDDLAHALDRLKAGPERRLALMFLDFDRFKLINDSLGHLVGDEFLVAVSRRIAQQVRPHDIVARLGGDEFAILIEHRDSERYAVTLADRLLDALRQPFHVAGTEIATSASIGITFSSVGYTSPADMLRDADTAMYKAKAGGKARYALFDAALHTEVSHRLRLEGDLRRALATGQLSVAYQPLFDLASGRITGFEALARWNHPELGEISPITFIAVAEDAALIVQLTDFVLRSACLQLREWQLRHAGWAGLNMHVNLSGNDIAHASLLGRVTSAIVEAGLQPQHLTLELTENILMERLEASLPTLHALRRIGIGLSVDDFGTGYSSLRHLASLPVDSLKIDRTFVADLQLGSNEAAILRAIVQLGDSLGKHIIAEGIETAAQMAQLRLMGCTAGQGHHLSRPLAAPMIDQLLDALAAPSAGEDQPACLQRPAFAH